MPEEIYDRRPEFRRPAPQRVPMESGRYMAFHSPSANMGRMFEGLFTPRPFARERTEAVLKQRKEKRARAYASHVKRTRAKKRHMQKHSETWTAFDPKNMF